MANHATPSFVPGPGYVGCLTPHFKQQMDAPRLGTGSQTARELGITPEVIKALLPAMFAASNGETCGATINGAANLYWRTAWSTRRNRIEVEVITLTPPGHLKTFKHTETRRVEL